MVMLVDLAKPLSHSQFNRLPFVVRHFQRRRSTTVLSTIINSTQYTVVQYVNTNTHKVVELAYSREP